MTTKASLSSLDRESSSSNASTLIHNRIKHLPISQQRVLLPIYKYRDHILYALQKNQVIVLESETGSGKSTQLPQYLHEAGWTRKAHTSNDGSNGIINSKMVVCSTQPRRMAAVAVAARVADEMGVTLGEEVGYGIRFDQKISSKTVIKFCTDGVLLKETMTDPLFSKYSVVIVDEAHERSLHTDILLGLLKKILRKRDDLRVIITSASLNAESFCDFFKRHRNSQPIPILSIQGRTFPVDIHYLGRPCRNYITCAVETILSIHKSEGSGDILVFLPGGEEIDAAIDMLNESLSNTCGDIYFIPLYSSLPVGMQLRVFETTPPGMRKVVLATNIAETSITIDGIRFVIDAGFVKLNYFNVQNSVEALVTCPVSKSAANQRAGRAGRTQPGKCYRLMTEPTFMTDLADFTTPEMQRIEISGAVLQLKALGISDVLHFDFLSPPSADSMIYALELLYSLGALDEDCRLTSAGENMADMPVDPRLARCLLNSFDFGCCEEMLTIAAMCAVEYPFISLRARASQESKKRLLECIGGFVSVTGDHLTLLNVFNQAKSHNWDPQWCDSVCLQHRILKRAQEIRYHLERMLKKFAPDGAAFSSCGDDTEAPRKCLVSGYFANAAQLGNDGLFHMVRGRTKVTVHPSSVLLRFGGALPEWVVFNDVVHTKDITMREVTKINPNWLVQFANHFYEIQR